ncbi:hypothetical protein BCR34DRAFT_558754 [Clohesyomyces aquaticus]|uniref:Uncharacterized protein n=1 Tax=Clohesyomyces aquaticus TaxID=1231657 RepID=A0A1Y1ZYS0_9PLEO|nr:hypothetical protein BCR34DRAFT_558754 [Clohesyomyces aquaticus]
MLTKYIVALCILLELTVVSIMLLTTRYLWTLKASKDPEDATTYSLDPKKPSDLFSGDTGLMKLFVPRKEVGVQIPTLSGVIAAGDEGVFTSALFEGLQGSPGEVSLDVLLDHFAAQLARRPMTERSSYPTAMASFLSNRGYGIRRSLSVKTNRAGSGRPTRPQRKSVDLTEKGLSRVLSRKTNPVLVETQSGLLLDSSMARDSKLSSRPSWTEQIQPSRTHDGIASTTVMPEELQSFSLILGAPISSAQPLVNPEKSATLVGEGAFGISILGSLAEDGAYQLSLHKRKLGISERSSRGSYSTLFAKHLATGSLPFSQNAETVNTILITNETLSRIKSGTPLQIEKPLPAQTASPNATFLSKLPNSRSVAFHTLCPSPSSSPSTSPLLTTISALPFTGGLVPLASSPLIRTIQFISSGGLPPGRLLQRLDALIDKTHRQAPHLRLFGPLFDERNAGALYREHQKLGKMGIGKLVEESVADKVARIQRYTTLLERLMAMAVRSDMSPSDVLKKVQEATTRELERAYADAQIAFCEDLFDPSAPAIPRRSANRVSSSSAGSGSRSSVSAEPSLRSDASTPSPSSARSAFSPRPSSTFQTPNLAQRVERMLKADAPLDVQSIAVVARLVLVAWTLCVGVVAWEDEDDGVRVADLGGFARVGEMVLS